jgi:endonuclease/exonuclease/phosphatase family metal-dependent hydrolase
MDFILLSESLAPALRSCTVLDSDLARQTSDHLPVLVDLKWG